MTPGDLIADRYRVLYRVGEGGMGSVWAAHDQTTATNVAIKFVSEEIMQWPDARARFLNEARTLDRLCHQNIVTALASGELPNGSPYLVLELLDGISLDAHL